MAFLTPVAAFFRYDKGALNALSWQANGSKGGDKLQQACFLSWTSFGTPEPGVHRPEPFGEIAAGWPATAGRGVTDTC